MRKTIIYLITLIAMYLLFDSFIKIYLDFKKLPEYSYGFLMGQCVWFAMAILSFIVLVRTIKRSKRK